MPNFVDPMAFWGMYGERSLARVVGAALFTPKLPQQGSIFSRPHRFVERASQNSLGSLLPIPEIQETQLDADSTGVSTKD